MTGPRLGGGAHGIDSQLLAHLLPQFDVVHLRTPFDGPIMCATGGGLVSGLKTMPRGLGPTHFQEVILSKMKDPPLVSEGRLDAPRSRC